MAGETGYDVIRNTDIKALYEGADLPFSLTTQEAKAAYLVMTLQLHVDDKIGVLREAAVSGESALNLLEDFALAASELKEEERFANQLAMELTVLLKNV
jgi:hypothetical protein